MAEPLDLTLYRAINKTWARTWDYAVERSADRLAALAAAHKLGQRTGEQVAVPDQFPWADEIVASTATAFATFRAAVLAELRKRGVDIEIGDYKND